MSQKPIKNEHLRKCHVAVIGTGVLGRQVAILLAGVGVRSMSLYDPQRVRKRHVAQGFFGIDQGLAKVDATADIAHQYHPRMELLTYRERLHPQHLLRWKSYSATAAFVCVNSPQDRRNVWSLVKDHAQFYSEGSWDENGAYALSLVLPESSTVNDYPSKNVSPILHSSRKLVAGTMTACLMVSQYLRWIYGSPVTTSMGCTL